MSDPYSNVEVREPWRLSVARFVRKLAVVEVLATAATLLVCWLAGWTSRIELADAIFLSGGLMASVGGWSLAVRWGVPLGRLPAGGIQGRNSTWLAERSAVVKEARGANRELPLSAFFVVGGGLLIAGRIAIGAFG